ncbi:hypothetical protein SAMN05444392_1238 [Seinonella peptonophila]|uniref:Uncharacterized protein n=1 Tax=Seinonella peptonophila TaxID=112248 RepID=A0A1M5BFP6_9BACL|nr:hypothetical protein SAMN05444392_1238 [Seinonella peptonophila]
MVQKYNWKEFGIGLGISCCLSFGVGLVTFSGLELYSFLIDSYDYDFFFLLMFSLLACTFFVILVQWNSIWGGKSSERRHGVFLIPILLFIFLFLTEVVRF